MARAQSLSTGQVLAVGALCTVTVSSLGRPVGSTEDFRVRLAGGVGTVYCKYCALVTLRVGSRAMWPQTFGQVPTDLTAVPGSDITAPATVPVLRLGS